jgi:ABC-type phosphate transport system substrate-binding protein
MSIRSLLQLRVLIYASVVLGLLLFRVVPSLKTRLPEVPSFSAVDSTLVISGTSLAPELASRLIEAYQGEYSGVRFDVRPGGTTHALEDLLNAQAEVAFLSRLPNESESLTMKGRGDSLSFFPVALGGIAALAGVSSELESISLAELRRLLQGETSVAPAPERLYLPEPNRGLWGVLVTELGLAAEAPPSLHWMPSEAEVLTAVSNDRNGLGLGSTLALPADLDAMGVRFVALRKEEGGEAFPATEQNVATADYPLYHYLYVSCGPAPGVLASGFVTYLCNGRGQRLVSRAGFLPARNVPRIIQLVSEPVGFTGS